MDTLSVEAGDVPGSARNDRAWGFAPAMNEN